MAVEFMMPKLGLTMEEGTIVEWLVPALGEVTPGMAVAFVETDKVHDRRLRAIPQIFERRQNVLHTIGGVGSVVGRKIFYVSFLLAARFAPFFIDWHLPPVGTPTQGVDAGFMANAWLRMKHENYDELRHMLDTVGQMVKVWAQ